MSGIVIDVEANTRKAQKNLDEVNVAVKNISSSVDGLTNGFKNAFVALGTAFTAGQLFDQFKTITSDLQQVENQIALVTGRSYELLEVQRKLRDVSKETYASYSDTASVFASFGRSMGDVKTSSADLLKLTTTIQKAIAISGSSPEAAKAAIIQLGQGLSAGALRGEELNSVMEQTPRIAKAIADSMHLTLGAMRLQAAEGKLTTEVLVRSFKEQAKVIDKEFNNVIPTVLSGLTRITEEAELIGNSFAKGLGAINLTGQTLSKLADTLGTTADSAFIIGASITSTFKNISNSLEYSLAATIIRVKRLFMAFSGALVETGIATFISNTAELLTVSFNNIFGAYERNRIRLGKLIKAPIEGNLFSRIFAFPAGALKQNFTDINDLLTLEVKRMGIDFRIKVKFLTKVFKFAGQDLWLAFSEGVADASKTVFRWTSTLAFFKYNFKLLLGDIITLASEFLAAAAVSFDTDGMINNFLNGFSPILGTLSRIFANVLNLASSFMDTLYKELSNSGFGAISSIFEPFAKILKWIIPVSLDFLFVSDKSLVDTTTAFVSNTLNQVLIGVEKSTKFLMELDIYTFLSDELTQVAMLFSEVFNTIEEWIDRIANALSKISLGDGVTNLFDGILLQTEKLKSVISVIKDFGDSVIDIFFKIYDAVIGHSWWTDTVENVVETSKSLWDNSKSGLNKFAAGIVRLFETVYNKIGGILSRLKELDFSDEIQSITDGLDSFVPGLGSVFTVLVTAAKYAFNAIEAMFNSQSTKSFLKEMGRGNFRDAFDPLISSAKAALAEMDNIFIAGSALLAASIATAFLPAALMNTLLGKAIGTIALVSGISLSIGVTDIVFDASLGEKIGKFIGGSLATVINNLFSDSNAGIVSETISAFSNFFNSLASGLPVVGLLYSGLMKIFDLFSLAPAAGIIGAFFLGKTLTSTLAAFGIYSKQMMSINKMFTNTTDFFTGKYAPKGPNVAGSISKNVYGGAYKTQALAATALVADYMGVFDGAFRNDPIGKAYLEVGAMYMLFAGDHGVARIKSEIIEPIKKGLISMTSSLTPGLMGFFQKGPRAWARGSDGLLRLTPSPSEFDKLRSGTGKFFSEFASNVNKYSQGGSNKSLLNQLFFGSGAVDPKGTFGKTLISWDKGINNAVANAKKSNNIMGEILKSMTVRRAMMVGVLAYALFSSVSQAAEPNKTQPMTPFTPLNPEPKPKTEDSMFDMSSANKVAIGAGIAWNALLIIKPLREQLIKFLAGETGILAILGSVTKFTATWSGKLIGAFFRNMIDLVTMSAQEWPARNLPPLVRLGQSIQVISKGLLATAFRSIFFLPEVLAPTSAKVFGNAMLASMSGIWKTVEMKSSSNAFTAGGLSYFAGIRKGYTNLKTIGNAIIDSAAKERASAFPQILRKIKPNFRLLEKELMATGPSGTAKYPFFARMMPDIKSGGKDLLKSSTLQEFLDKTRAGLAEGMKTNAAYYKSLDTISGRAKASMLSSALTVTTFQISNWQRLFRAVSMTGTALTNIAKLRYAVLPLLAFAVGQLASYRLSDTRKEGEKPPGLFGTDKRFGVDYLGTMPMLDTQMPVLPFALSAGLTAFQINRAIKKRQLAQATNLFEMGGSIGEAPTKESLMAEKVRNKSSIRFAEMTTEERAGLRIPATAQTYAAMGTGTPENIAKRTAKFNAMPVIEQRAQIIPATMNTYLAHQNELLNDPRRNPFGAAGKFGAGVAASIGGATALIGGGAIGAAIGNKLGGEEGASYGVALGTMVGFHFMGAFKNALVGLAEGIGLARFGGMIAFPVLTTGVLISFLVGDGSMMDQIQRLIDSSKALLGFKTDPVELKTGLKTSTMNELGLSGLTVSDKREKINFKALLPNDEKILTEKKDALDAAAVAQYKERKGPTGAVSQATSDAFKTAASEFNSAMEIAYLTTQRQAKDIFATLGEDLVPRSGFFDEVSSVFSDKTSKIDSGMDYKNFRIPDEKGFLYTDASKELGRDFIKTVQEARKVYQNPAADPTVNRDILDELDKLSQLKTSLTDTTTATGFLDEGKAKNVSKSLKNSVQKVKDLTSEGNYKINDAAARNSYTNSMTDVSTKLKAADYTGDISKINLPALEGSSEFRGYLDRLSVTAKLLKKPIGDKERQSLMDAKAQDFKIVEMLIKQADESTKSTVTQLGDFESELGLTLPASLKKVSDPASLNPLIDQLKDSVRNKLYSEMRVGELYQAPTEGLSPYSDERKRIDAENEIRAKEYNARKEAITKGTANYNLSRMRSVKTASEIQFKDPGAFQDLLKNGSFGIDVRQLLAGSGMEETRKVIKEIQDLQNQKEIGLLDPAVDFEKLNDINNNLDDIVEKYKTIDMSTSSLLDGLKNVEIRGLAGSSYREMQDRGIEIARLRRDLAKGKDKMSKSDFDAKSAELDQKIYENQQASLSARMGTSEAMQSTFAAAGWNTASIQEAVGLQTLDSYNQLAITLERLKEAQKNAEPGLALGYNAQIASVERAMDSLKNHSFETGQTIQNTFSGVGLSSASDFKRVPESAVKEFYSLGREIEAVQYLMTQPMSVGQFNALEDKLITLEERSKALNSTYASISTKFASVNEVFGTSLSNMDFVSLGSGLTNALAKTAQSLKTQLADEMEKGFLSVKAEGLIVALDELSTKGEYLKFFADLAKNTRESFKAGFQSSLDKIKAALPDLEISMYRLASMKDQGKGLAKEAFDISAIETLLGKGNLLSDSQKEIISGYDKYNAAEILTKLKDDFAKTGGDFAKALETPLESSTTATNNLVTSLGDLGIKVDALATAFSNPPTPAATVPAVPTVPDTNILSPYLPPSTNTLTGPRSNSWLNEIPQKVEAVTKSTVELMAEASKSLGLDPRVLEAISNLETHNREKVREAKGGGSSHNLFNIKAGKSWKGNVSARPATDDPSYFKAYSTDAASILDMVALMKSKRYAAAMANPKDTAAVLQGLQDAGYAGESKDWADLILKSLGAKSTKKPAKATTSNKEIDPQAIANVAIRKQEITSKYKSEIDKFSEIRMNFGSDIRGALVKAGTIDQDLANQLGDESVNYLETLARRIANQTDYIKTAASNNQPVDEYIAALDKTLTSKTAYLEGFNALRDLKVSPQNQADEFRKGSKNNISLYLSRFGKMSDEAVGYLDKIQMKQAEALTDQLVDAETRLKAAKDENKETVDLQREVDNLNDKLKDLGDAAQTAAKMAEDAGKTFAANTTGTFKDAFKGMLLGEADKDKTPFQTFVKKLKTGLKDQLAEMFTNSMMNSFELGKGGSITKLLEKGGKLTSSAFSGIGNGIKDTLSGNMTWDKFSGGISSWWNDLTSSTDTANKTPEVRFDDATVRFDKTVDKIIAAVNGAGVGGTAKESSSALGAVSALGPTALKGIAALTKGGMSKEDIKTFTESSSLNKLSLDAIGSPSTADGFSEGALASIGSTKQGAQALEIAAAQKSETSWWSDMFSSKEDVSQYASGLHMPGETNTYGEALPETSWLDDIGKFFTDIKWSELFSWLPGMATGGQVSGAGTGTSDSIPTLLSNGEFVVNAKDTKKNRHILEAINNGSIVRRAAGGFMGALGTVTPVLGMGANLINQFTGNDANSKLLKAAEHLERAAKALENAVGNGGLGGATDAMQNASKQTKDSADSFSSFFKGSESGPNANGVTNGYAADGTDLAYPLTGMISGADMNAPSAITQGIADTSGYGSGTIEPLLPASNPASSGFIGPRQGADQQGFLDSIADSFSNFFSKEGAGGSIWSSFTELLGGADGKGGLFGGLMHMFDGTGAGASTGGGGGILGSMSGGDGIMGFFGKIGNFFGNIGGAATGGSISGSGTGTSDSIPTMLSNGEFVVNAAAASKNLGMLHAINSGKVQHHNLGAFLGPLGSIMSIASSAKGFADGPAEAAGGAATGGIMGMISKFLGMFSGLFGKLFGGAGGGLSSMFGNLFGGGGASPLGAAGDASMANMFSGSSLGLSFARKGGLFLAGGGQVSGPGTGTSDSIPAMLSHGEYVINAAATARHRDLLHQINSGRVPQFAAGGIVDAAAPVMTVPIAGNIKQSSSISASNKGQQVINLNITGDISRQTKSEIYKMMPSIADGVNSQNKEKGYRR